MFDLLDSAHFPLIFLGFILYYTTKKAEFIEEKTIISRINRYYSVLESLHPQSLVYWHGEWPAGWIEKNRRLYDYELVYVSSGSGRVTTETKSFHCDTGSLMLIPPRLLHYSDTQRGMERWCLHIDWHGKCLAQKEMDMPYVFEDTAKPLYEELVAAAPPSECFPEFPLHLLLKEEQREIMLSALREFFMQPVETLAAAARRQAVLWRILSFAFEESIPAETRHREKQNSIFFQAKAMMDREFHNPDLELSHIARTLRITPNYLLKLFRRELGMSAQGYLQNLRLTHAENLLGTTNLSIGEIALDSGFSDGNYFARFFRLKHGISPRRFRLSLELTPPPRLAGVKEGHISSY